MRFEAGGTGRAKFTAVPVTPGIRASYGNQDYVDIGGKLRARAVRRLPFNHSSIFRSVSNEPHHDAVSEQIKLAQMIAWIG